MFNRGPTLIQHPFRLHLRKYFAKITDVAQDRKHWRGIASQIQKAAEVSQTKKLDEIYANKLVSQLALSTKNWDAMQR